VLVRLSTIQCIPPSTSPRAAIRRLALGRLISVAGTDASAIAIGWALYEQTHSAQWLSLSLLITIGGSSLLAPLGGKLGDRVDRRRLMIACEVVSAAVFASLIVLHSPAALLAASVIATASGALYGPAAGAAIAQLAGDKDLSWANGQLATGGNIGRTAGRLAAGVLVAALGVGAVFALDAVTFALSAALTASVRLPFGRVIDAGRERLRGGAVGELLRHPVLRPLAASACVSTFVTSFSMTAEVPLALELGAGAVGLGLLAAGWGLGMVAGSYYGGRALHVDNEATGVLVGRLMMAAGIGLTALAPTLGPAVAAYVAGGLGGGFMGVASQSLILRRTPEHMRARMLASLDMVRNASFGVGVLLAGLVVGALGPRPVYALVGGGVLLGCLPLLALVRRLGGPRALRPAAAVA
jgi:MFS family permease